MLRFGLEGAEVADPCLPAAVSHVLGMVVLPQGSMEGAIAPVA